jgi:L-fuconolactonase
MRIIDSHVHFWNYDLQRHGWISDEMAVIRKDFLPPDAERIFRDNKVEGCVAVQADTTDGETEFLLTKARENGFIKGVVGWTDLCSSELETKLQVYSQEALLKGFREIMQGSPDEQFLANKSFREGLGKLQGFGFTFDLLIYHYQLPATIRLTEKFPEQRFILDHIAKPDIRSGEWKKWKEGIRELARHPNTFCKLSGMITEADYTRWHYDQIKPYMEIVAEFFGTDRLCFGSDWPVCLVAGRYKQVVEVVERFLEQVSPEEREMVMSGNIMQFYNLS